MLSADEEDAGFDVCETNDSIGDPRLNCGGAAVTVSVTAIDCDLPAHGCDVHVTVTVPAYGEPAAVRLNAAPFGPTVILPGVDVAPDPVSHGADDDVVKFRTSATTVALTTTVLGAGAAVVPAVSANDAVAADNTRSGEGGLIVKLTGCFAVTGGVAESVATIVNPNVFAVPGVPAICPFENDRPSGKVPVMLNV
jgi:hypothetical protein